MEVVADFRRKPDTDISGLFNRLHIYIIDIRSPGVKTPGLLAYPSTFMQKKEKPFL